MIELSWSEKVSWSSTVTLRFLTDIDGVIEVESSWIVKSIVRTLPGMLSGPAVA